jgi:hypothetical protein
MRHLIGLALAIGLAAAVFFAAAWGYLRLLKVPVVNGGASTLPGGGGSLIHDTNVLWPVVAIAGTLLLAGILVAVARISPLAAGLPGLVFIAWTVVFLLNVQRAVRYIPLRSDAFGDGFEAMLFNGVLGALGLLLVVPMFIPSRWWRRTVTVATTSGGAIEVPEPEPATTSLISSDWSAPTATYPQDPPAAD